MLKKMLLSSLFAFLFVLTAHAVIIPGMHIPSPFNPLYSDVDRDGWELWIELRYGTDPRDSDSDNDYVIDGEEDPYPGPTPDYLDPLDPDTDDDGYCDGWEVGFGSDPSNSLDHPTGTAGPDWPGVGPCPY